MSVDEGITASASAVILKDGKILIARRADDEGLLNGYWEVVGGGVEPGETAEAAVLREAYEESGLKITCGESYHSFPFNLSDGRPMRAFAFMCTIDGSSDVVLSEEHIDYKWISEEELDNVQPMTDKMRGMIKAGFELANSRS